MVGSELVAHVGFPQTGAAVLQQALGRLRPQLHRHGIGLVDHAAMAGLASCAGWQRELVTDPGALRAFERDLGELVAREAAEVAGQSGVGLRATVISSDHLVGRHPLAGGSAEAVGQLAVPALAQAIRATGATGVRLVGYLRRQDRLMERCYLQAIQDGATHSFAEQFPHRFEPVLDYLALLDRLRQLPEVQQVHVRPVELVGSGAARYADDFLSTLGLGGALDLTPVGADLADEPLYSRRAVDIAVDINPFLESEQERRRVREFLLAHFPATSDDDTCVLPGDERRRILAAYAPVNRQLFERFLPHLAPDAYATPAATAELAGASAPAGAPPLGAPTASRPATGPRRAALADRRWWSAVRRRRRLLRADVVMTARPACGLGWLRLLMGLALARHAGSSPHDPLGVTAAGAAVGGGPRILAVPAGRPGWARRRPPLGLGGRTTIVVARDPRERELRDLEALLAFYDVWAEERRRRPTEVMVVRYEDLLADPPAVLADVLAFAGVGPVAQRWVGHVVEESSFDQLAAAHRAGAHEESKPGHLAGETARGVEQRIGDSAGAAAFGYGPAQVTEGRSTARG